MSALPMSAPGQGQMSALPAFGTIRPIDTIPANQPTCTYSTSRRCMLPDASLIEILT
jgi:hypothetical protein